MKQIIKKVIQTAAFVPMLALVASLAAPVAPSYAVDCSNDPVSTGITGAAECAQGEGQSDSLTDQDTGVFRTVTNILLFIVGAVAVIMLVIGGIRYTISGGDQNQVTAAKNTILYAIIGIVVAILAYAAVNFVIDSFSTTTA